jgi:hypothetical protein
MTDALPHHGVYARLGVSDIHGIGVFAIRPIGAGTNLFANDSVALNWIEADALAGADMSDAERRLYHDFGINRGGRIGCPLNFNNLTPGWYLNEPPAGEPPNVSVDAELNFVACRDIAAGEELTVRYTQFSDLPDQKASFSAQP